MAKVTDVLDQEDVTVGTQLPVTNEPGSSSERNAGAIEEALAGAEGSQEQGTQELSAADIRAEVGDLAEGLSDVELLAEYKKAQVEEPVAELADIPMYNAQGTKVDPAKISVADLLSGKVTIAYNAMNKEQRKTLNDLRRTAANGHYNEHKYTTATSERDQIRTKYQAMDTEHKVWAQDRQTWDRVLAAAAAGNVDPLQKLITAYSESVGKLPEAAVEQEDPGLEAAGQRFIAETIDPASVSLAKQYGHGNPIEIKNVALHLMEQEGEFLTKEKADAILQYELPALLEKAGYTAGGKAIAVQDTTATELATLKKQMAELTAGKANDRTAAIRAKVKKAPPAGGGNTASGGDSIPAKALASREGYKAWMRGDE